MHEDTDRQLRVLISNENQASLEILGKVVVALGHEVVAREIHVENVAETTRRERPDVALVGLGQSSQHALDLVSHIVQEAACPVIAILHDTDDEYVRKAAKQGVFAYIVDGNPEELQSTIEITLHRFAEYHNLQGAFGRRSTIEQAKGILMSRHSIDAEKAFEMMRNHSQHHGIKLISVAEGIVDSHLLMDTKG